VSSLRILDWANLDAAARAAALARPRTDERADVVAQARETIAAVRARGDDALRELTQRFDGVALEALAVDRAEFHAAERALDPADVAAIDRASANVRAFHAAQRLAPLALDTEPGVRCERLSRPIRAVGLYVPAGSAALPSTAIMLAVPAALAGCPQRILCTPPDREGRANAAVLVAARRCGVDTVFKVGGAQAIAALAYGTASIPKVDKIFGPGNAWVTAAKQLVAADPGGAALDLPAGPSEVLVIADVSARAEFVAADLLAQAEHDARAQALLVTTSRALAERVAAEIMRQHGTCRRAAILAQSMATSRAIIVADLETAFAVSNAYAPEHLLLQVRQPRQWLDAVTAAGSIFLGDWSPEPMGDYCSGTNHVLPTYGHARSTSGLSLADFMTRITVQELTPSGLESLGPVAARLARLEGLDAHAAAVDVRLAALRRAELA
jgi:histidinol dehydrogenase